MYYDTSNETIYRVLRGKDGRWEVTQETAKRPLARFDRMDDAMQYARDVQAENRRFAWLTDRQA